VGRGLRNDCEGVWARLRGGGPFIGWGDKASGQGSSGRWRWWATSMPLTVTRHEGGRGVTGEGR
jgi:hypothetical protein